MDKKTEIANKKTFYQVLGNSAVALLVNMTVWFAITFYVYLQTKSVFATAMLAGIYLVATATTGIWFGSLVDHHKKKTMMLVSSFVSALAFALAFVMYVVLGDVAFRDVANPILWVFILLLMGGVLLSNIRMITLPTLVTILIPEKVRDKANGLVGSVTGVGFLVTSVISGLLVGYSGMFLPLLLGVLVNVLVMIHLWFMHIPERSVVHLEDQPKKIDIRGTMKVISKIPGLYALIIFSAFNNLLGGVFMALMDAYGLSLVSVQAWGFIWGFLSCGFIIGGLLIAKRGLGKNPLKTLLIVNIIMWTVSIFFTIQSSIVLLIIGTMIYMILGPYAEASEQTVLQKVVPQERQGRVFGFAQSVEQSASPLTAFVIGPLTQFIFIPFMSYGAGAELIGSWYGTGPERGIAIVFSIAGLIGLIATLLALSSKYYRQLRDHYLRPAEEI